MFDRYSETARRAIFFARYDAGSFGNPYMETEHLLLGLLHEPAVVNEFFPSDSPESIRREISEHTYVGKPIPTSVDLPVSKGLMRVFEHAEEEANALSHEQIKPGHLLLGLLREEGFLAARILHGQGLTLASLREKLAQLHNP